MTTQFIKRIGLIVFQGIILYAGLVGSMDKIVPAQINTTIPQLRYR